MTDTLPMADEEYFEEVDHQGKKLKVDDTVLIQEAGGPRTVLVTGLVKKEGHYWVAYDDNTKLCPWPLVHRVNR